VRRPTTSLVSGLVTGLLAGGMAVAAGVALGVRAAGQPALERRFDRAMAILEADRSRLLNLLLARTPTDALALQATSPAHPPGPDPTLTGRRPDQPTVGDLYTEDLNELGWDAEDDAALRVARG
jgi:hypothetical protein